MRAGILELCSYSARIMYSALRIFTVLLMIALLGAQSLPCGITQADLLHEQPNTSPSLTQTLPKVHGHLSHADGAMEQAASDEDCEHDAHPSLRAYCTCGCSDTTQSKLPAYRLGVSLVSAAPEIMDPLEENQPLGPASTMLPAGPFFAIEHVPLFV